MLKKFLILIGLLALMSTNAFAGLNAEQKRNKNLVRRTAQEQKVDVNFADAIARVESDYLNSAYNNARKGKKNENYISRGIMQLTIHTGRRFNKQIQTIEDLYMREKNVLAGVRYIKYLFKKYPNLSYYEIAQVYNLGERKYFEMGVRNPKYADKVLREFYKLKREEKEIGQSQTQEKVIYTVIKGDTLDDIAQNFNTTVTELAIKNNIADVDYIEIGQEIEI